MTEEKKIKSSINPLSIENIECILKQMKSSICKIEYKNNKGTGFFFKLPFENKNVQVLITNSHILNNDIKLNDKITLLLNEGKEKKILNKNRKIYVKKELDILIIEIKDKDKINNYLELDENILNKDYENMYKYHPIYILQYSKEKNALVSFGTINNIYNNDILHLVNTEKGSSGAPILNLSNYKVIGIHKGGSDRFTFNKGTFLKEFLYDFQSNSKFSSNHSVSRKTKTLTKEKKKKEKPKYDLSINYNYSKSYEHINSVTNDYNKKETSNTDLPNNNYNQKSAKYMNSYNKKKTITQFDPRNNYCICKKCQTFPLINFDSSLNRLNITCCCENKQNENVLFVLNNYTVLKNENNILYCKEHKKIFNYYCEKCSCDICDDCLLQKDDHSNHQLKIFDILKFDINIKIKEIKEKFFIDNKNLKNDEIKKHFGIFINIIINEIEISPTFNLFKTIENIYNSLMEKEMKINSLEDFEKVKKTEQITSLLFINQKIDNIKKLFNTSLINLKVLSLQNTSINDLSPLLNCNLENLHFLDLSYNQLDNNAIDIFGKLELKKLNLLNLYSNKLTNCSFFKSIEHFSSLKELYVGNNKFEFNEYNDENYILPNIQEISLCDNVFKNETINSISKFKFNNLKKINLNNNSLNSLSFIEKLECANLEKLFLNNNKISELFNKYECFSKIINLQLIEIKDNQVNDLDNINEFVNKLTKLSMLNLKGNNINLNINNINILGEIISKKKIKIIVLN